MDFSCKQYQLDSTIPSSSALQIRKYRLRNARLLWLKSLLETESEETLNHSSYHQDTKSKKKNHPSD